jgi:agmatinase
MLLIKAPFSGGSLGKNDGCEKAPDAIVSELEKCYLAENFSFQRPDVKGLAMNSSNIEESFMVIQEFIAATEGPFILVGGDHSITFPAFKGSRGDGLLVLDAHADSVNEFDPPTHEDFIRTLVAKGHIKPENIVMVGLRNIHKIELDFLRAKNIRMFPMKNCHEVGIQDVTTAIMESCQRFKRLYLSIDIDVVDPAFAPGTGYPEPGGFTSREIIHMLQRIAMMRNLCGIDLVEINPDKDLNSTTVRLGARLIRELIPFSKGKL